MRVDERYPTYDKPMRPLVEFIKEKFGDTELIGVEIGVAGGIHANSMLDNLNIKKLYLIDPYIDYYDIRTDRKKKRELHQD